MDRSVLLIKQSREVAPIMAMIRSPIMLYDLGSTGNVLLTQREHLFLSKTDDFRGSQGELDHNVMRLFSQFLDYQIFVVLGKTGTFQYVMSKRPKTGFHSIAFYSLQNCADTQQVLQVSPASPVPLSLIEFSGGSFLSHYLD